MDKTTKQLKIWRIIAIAAIIALLTVCILYAFGVGRKSNSPAIDGNKALSLWNEGTGAKKSLIDYVNAVTKEGGADFIPVEDRIAVFDMDGTLTCETFYTYYDTMMFIEYCLHDHPERVADELKAVAASIKPGYVADETLARNFAKAYAGIGLPGRHVCRRVVHADGFEARRQQWHDCRWDCCRETYRRQEQRRRVHHERLGQRL